MSTLLSALRRTTCSACPCLGSSSWLHKLGGGAPLAVHSERPASRAEGSWGLCFNVWDWPGRWVLGQDLSMALLNL